MKADPQKEMEKVVNFLDVRTDYESKYECLFGENSQRFKRSSERDVDPYLFVNEGLILSSNNLFKYFYREPKASKRSNQESFCPAKENSWD